MCRCVVSGVRASYAPAVCSFKPFHQGKSASLLMTTANCSTVNRVRPRAACVSALCVSPRARHLMRLALSKSLLACDATEVFMLSCDPI